MPLMRRTRPSVAAPTPAPVEERQETRRDGDRRAGDRRITVRPQLSPSEILAKAAQRTATPNSANSAVERNVVQRAAKEAIDAELKLISKAENDIDDAQRRLTESHGRIEELLRGALLTMHTDGVYLAEIVEQWTRQSRNIDPKKFKNQVSNEVFWSSIKVNLEAAGKHLTEKEVNEIADVVPSTKTGETLKVKKLEPVKRSKRG